MSNRSPRCPLHSRNLQMLGSAARFVRCISLPSIVYSLDRVEIGLAADEVCVSKRCRGYPSSIELFLTRSAAAVDGVRGRERDRSPREDELIHARYNSQERPRES